MVFSSDRKLALSGWLINNAPFTYESRLKHQKFLFLYEAFSKVENDNPEFSKLKGYVNGPVFSTVFGDRNHNKKEFESAAVSAYKSGKSTINEERLRKALFLVSSMSESELSELTHHFNIWKVHEKEIKANHSDINLSENDFDDNDMNFSMALLNLYSNEIIDNTVIIPVNNKYFVFPKNDESKIDSLVADVLFQLSNNNDLHNPVFAEVDEHKRVVIND